MSSIMDYVWAFVVGGALCFIAQLLIDKTAMTPARILVLYVSAGVVLGGIGVYGALVDFAGAGATTPLTGFGYLIAEGVREAVDEQGEVIGTLKDVLQNGPAGSRRHSSSVSLLPPSSKASRSGEKMGNSCVVYLYTFR